MKEHIISFILVLLLSALALSIKAYSQPPCEMDCPQSPWIPATSVWYPVDPVSCPGCSLRFNYWYRPSACGIYKDLQMGEITLTLPCLSCPLSVKDYVNFAIDKMILNNEIPKPDTGKCETFWRAINASCWGFLVSGNDTTLMPCQPSECCWRTLTMCRDSLGNLSYTQHPPYTTPDICYIYPYPCTFVCDEIPQSAPTPTDAEENTNIQNGFSTFVYPNPGTDWFNIKFRSESEGKHTIEVYDESGNLITIKDFGKVRGEIFIQLNMSGYASGVYRYVIKRNGIDGISGSFNLAR